VEIPIKRTVIIPPNVKAASTTELRSIIVFTPFPHRGPNGLFINAPYHLQCW
jgi:hypothetical protein